MDLNAARRLLFHIHKGDMRSAGTRATVIPPIDELMVWVIVAPGLGICPQTGAFMPVGHPPEIFFEENGPNIPSTDPIVGIYFDHIDAAIRCKAVAEEVGEQVENLEVMLQTVEYQKAIEIVASVGAHGYVHFGGSNNIFLHKNLVQLYDAMEDLRKQHAGDFSKLVLDLADKLKVSPLVAEIIESELKLYRGFVEIETSVVEDANDLKPVIDITLRERQDISGRFPVEILLTGTKERLHDALCGDGMPFSGMIAKYEPAKEIALGPGSIEL